MSLDDSRGWMPSDDQRLAAVLHGAEVRLATLELGHEHLIVALHVVEVEVPVGPIAVGLGLLLLIEPGQLGVGGGDEVVQGVQVGHPFVGQNEELVVRLLQDGHAFAIDLELLSVETDLGLAAFFYVALELVDDFVLFLVTLVFGFDGLNVGAIISLLDLFL